MTDVSFSLAFLAGVLSFLSPCVLPLVPSYLSFITGLSFDRLTSDEDKGRVKRLTLKNSSLFIAGFSVVFISLGASSSFIGQVLFDYQNWIRIIGGGLVIIFGLFISGIIRLDFLMRERKFHLHGRPAGYIGAFVVGMTFAAGWTPCIGPILGTILLYASTKGSTTYGLKLLTVYSIGLAVPFLLASLAMNTFLSYMKVFYKWMRAIMFISGALLIVFGIMLLTNQVRYLASLLPDLGIKF